MIDRDFFGLRTAYEMAQESPDPRTQVGAVIISDNEVIGTGYNTFPRKVLQTNDRWTSPAKHQFVEHAERNAIYDAALKGYTTLNATMYCSWYACEHCARAVIQSGIKEIVGHFRPEYQSNGWSKSIDVGLQMFKEAKVNFRYIEADFGMEILFDGKKIKV